MRRQRLVSDIYQAREETEHTIEQSLIDRLKLVERFGKIAMAQMRRKIGNDNLACMADAFYLWLDMLEEIQAERQRTLAREAARKKALERRMEAAARLLGRSKHALLVSCCSGWHAVWVAALIEKRQYEDCMAESLKRLFGSAKALQADVIFEWRGAVQKQILQRQFDEMETASNVLSRARLRALAMLEKNARSSADLFIPTCFFSWHEETQVSRLYWKRKRMFMTFVLRQIQGKEAMLMSMSLRSWARVAQIQKDFVKERLLADQACRMRFSGLAHGTIMRLHRRLGVAHTFEAWLKRANASGGAADNKDNDA